VGLPRRPVRGVREAFASLDTRDLLSAILLDQYVVAIYVILIPIVGQEASGTGQVRQFMDQDEYLRLEGAACILRISGSHGVGRIEEGTVCVYCNR
jgi:hypothetical protein